MNATAVHAMIPSTLVSESSSFCSGDFVRVTEVSIVAIWPISVRMPVAVTTIARFRASPTCSGKHVGPVADRDLARQDAGVLRHRGALAGQRGLLCLERRRP